MNTQSKGPIQNLVFCCGHLQHMVEETWPKKCLGWDTTQMEKEDVQGIVPDRYLLDRAEQRGNCQVEMIEVPRSVAETQQEFGLIKKLISGAPKREKITQRMGAKHRVSQFLLITDHDYTRTPLSLVRKHVVLDKTKITL